MGLRKQEKQIATSPFHFMQLLLSAWDLMIVQCQWAVGKFLPSSLYLYLTGADAEHTGKYKVLVLSVYSTKYTVFHPPHPYPGSSVPSFLHPMKIQFT